MNVMIIDDVSVALDAMADIGRVIAGPPSDTIREEVLTFARKRGWPVIPYASYVHWAAELMRAAVCEWVILDPLFPADVCPSNSRRLRITRVDGGHRFDAEYLTSRVPDGLGILDDAAATGATLRHVTLGAAQQGKRIGTFALCAATRMARERIVSRDARIQWRQQIQGDWTVMHLRDGCPHLPFTGRRVDRPTSLASTDAPVEIRLAAHSLPGTPWQSLFVVGVIRAAIVAAQREVAAKLSNLIGHEATVADIACLGSHVPALGPSAQPVTAATPLRDLIPAV